MSEADLTFKQALELAQGMEAAEKNARLLKGSKPSIKKLSSSQWKCGRRSESGPM